MSSVPSAYVGLWRREELVDAEGRRDTSTEVYWLQSHGLYVDLRVPAGCPDAHDGATTPEWLARYRDWLARQEGFAGMLDVQGDLCHWQRVLDLQPPGDFDDRGRVFFTDAAHMVETGIHGDYVERWRKTTTSSEARLVLALRLIPSTRARAGVLVVVGNDFMYAIDWGEPQPLSGRVGPGPTIDASLSGGCEIGYGHVGGTAPWSVVRSSLPAAEGGQLLPEKVTFPPVGMTWTPPTSSLLAQTASRWMVLEHRHPSAHLASPSF